MTSLKDGWPLRYVKRYPDFLFSSYSCDDFVVNDTPDEKLNELRSSLIQFHNERSNTTTQTPSSSCNGTGEVNGGEEDNNDDEEESSNDASSKSDKVSISPTPFCDHHS